jgi:hypothetical protein
MADGSALAASDNVRHEAICDGCDKTVFGIRHQCQTCPDWNYCNKCIANAPRKHAHHNFSVIYDPQRARDTASVRRQALDFGRLETRFLRIEPSAASPSLPTEASARVSCELEIRSLYECPKYTALSYSWGDTSSLQSIILEGRITQVIASREEALKELAARGVKVAWVDALCIDQENKHEKGYQLRHMGTIFSQAAKVVAWLGATAEDSDNAMQALATMCETDDVDRHGHAIARLLKRQYWQRVWIIQELAKASSVEVWCGTQMLTWDTFVKGAQKWLSTSKLWASDYDHPVFTIKHFCDAERSSRTGAARMLLSTAMTRTLHCNSALHRDRVYALLGLTRDGTEMVPLPNYVQSDPEVFESILRRMIVGQGQLDLILVASLGRSELSFPSWLPTWDNEMPLQVGPWISRCFEDPRGKENAVHCQGDVLEVRGQILGRLWPGHGVGNLETITTYLDFVAKTFEMCSDRDHSRKARRLEWLVYARPRVLSDFWRSLADEDRTRCPKLRQWFSKYAHPRHVDHDTSASTSRFSIEQLRDQENTVRDRYVIARISENDLELQHQDSSPELWHCLEQLEALVGTLGRHGVELWWMGGLLGRAKLVIVPSNTRTNDYVARIEHCSLPVVLRGNSDGRYSVVGGVAETLEWDSDSSDQHKGESWLNIRSEYTAALDALTVWPVWDYIEWRTLYLI